MRSREIGQRGASVTHRDVHCRGCSSHWLERAVTTGTVRCPACGAPTRISAAEGRRTRHDNLGRPTQL